MWEAFWLVLSGASLVIVAEYGIARWLAGFIREHD